MSFDTRLLFFLNHWVGRSAEVDSVLRILAVWGPLWGAWEVARPWLLDEKPATSLRILRDSVLAGAIALVAAQYLARLHPGARPFLQLPVVLLYLAPNNASFPDLVTALGVGVVSGAVRRQRDRWVPAGMITVAWVIARAMSGTMRPSDSAAALLVGILPVLVENLLARLPISRWTGRAAVALVGLVILGMVRVVHHTPVKLPPQSTSSEMTPQATATGPERDVPDPRMKGFDPGEEAKILAVVDAIPSPPPVERVEVGHDRWIEVAGVKLRAGDRWDSHSRGVTERDSARTLRALFKGCPQLDEIDLWAVVPFVGHNGKQALRPVLFLQAMKKKNGALLAANDADIDGHAGPLLRTFGTVYALPHDFPRPGQALPNGVAEGAG